MNPTRNCAKSDPDIFFPASEDDPELRAEYDDHVAYVNAHYCGTCPARLGCLSDALTEPETYGIWGGVGRHERRAFLRRHRDRGRALRCEGCGLQLSPETIRNAVPFCAACIPVEEAS